MRNERDIEKRIEAIEEQLSTLKLELKEIRREKRTGPIKKGDRVNILNPNRVRGVQASYRRLICTQNVSQLKLTTYAG